MDDRDFLYYKLHLSLWLRGVKKIFFGVSGGGGVEGQTDKQAQTNLPLNFFEVGGITMHKCTSYDPDKLHL